MESISLNKSIMPSYNLMKATFGIVPIVAGLDKFTNLLTDWSHYISPGMAGMLPLAPHAFMMIVGVIEMAAGVIVLAKPTIGGYILAAWLAVIALTLLAGGNYLDVAVRDLVMATGAFTLARIANFISSKTTKITA